MQERDTKHTDGHVRGGALSFAVDIVLIKVKTKDWLMNSNYQVFQDVRSIVKV